MAEITNLVNTLVDKAVEKELIEASDRIYSRNQVLGILEEVAYQEDAPALELDIPDVLEKLADLAVEKQLIEGLLDEREQLTAKIMDAFLSKPSEINAAFYQKYQDSAEAATDYFYQLSKDSNYIQTKRIAHNIQFKTPSAYGELDITINLSKPEKDPEQIRREKEMKQDSAYPKCLLCAENEGYVGRIGHPARSNHRIIEVPLEDESWFLQYSPYVYYNEHSIIFAREHRPMKIDWNSFARLTAFVEKFPHYFVGSNADLPIVGGSILSHDHYQGGHYTFAMTDAEEEFAFDLGAFSDVKAVVVKWPLSVIRLRHQDRHKLVEASDYILQKWRDYSDPDADILAYTDTTPHNTITPIARKRNGQFEMDLVLRNNRTTDEHPMGIFHPHEDVHHIKKENIGLIEVMGLAVLPPRLKDELEIIKQHLLDETITVADYHANWVQSIKDSFESITEANVDKIVEDELGKKFARVLEDAGVYKTDTAGRTAFKRFLSHLNEA
ncbi:UDP-glucose--hexose-1-phosphate uridylyltransferase [Gracilibacillus caseinilyticus]|uniref:Galactose-1-phosphate uridylyltransferase n=1 Tax=Gracilibacillus caseinilyticus TaxID=2932256 RepID=A0ABY4F202_9BACI|nr:UDP-glucose--hexose-1-phosphate uridylyltransferase [Gracilibacillus caseinilyticus]UOQ50103.1 UDP-glucose--hexose-1-phosphate uridylyltransferase [Gracilibacillus caseinilyticus]